MRRNWTFAAIAAVFTLGLSIVSADEIATLRDGVSIDDEAVPAAIPKTVDSDIKVQRNYPMQPPTIPHDTRGYEVNRNVNKCMSCHARTRTEDSQAPMVSVTHFMDRDGNFLAEISPRRYFCNQCHVNQTEARDLVDNTYQDMHELIEERSAKEDD